MRTQHRIFRESRRAGSKRFIKFFFNKLAPQEQEEYGRRRPIERIHFQISTDVIRHLMLKLNRVSSSDVAPIIFSDNTHDVTMYLYTLPLKTESRESSAAHKE